MPVSGRSPINHKPAPINRRPKSAPKPAPKPAPGTPGVTVN
jgi:hypothetical protein